VTRERLTPLTLFALVGAVGGTVLLVAARPHLNAGSVSFLGVFLAFLSACAYAGFILCRRLLTVSYHPLQINFVAFGTGALLLLFCTSSTRLVLVYPASGWLLLLYLGCVPGALGYALFQTGMRSLSATMASTVSILGRCCLPGWLSISVPGHSAHAHASAFHHLAYTYSSGWPHVHGRGGHL
jgi:DME family drug/metabolite transporter